MDMSEGQTGETKPAPEAPAASPADRLQEFRQAWVLCLMDNLKASIPEAALGAVMEACGRGCARRNAAALTAQAGGNLDTLLSSFGAQIGAGNVSNEDNVLHLRYPRCYCPMVSAGPARLPEAYCECGRGFVLEVFSAVAGKPVSVELSQSIQRGDPQCHFVVRV
jgi:predicted hydrocarbon binding protein